MGHQARETARELRTLRHAVSTRGIGAELQGVLQTTSADDTDGHSRFTPPERLGELQHLRRSSRVSGLLERSGAFRRGLETMLQALPAPGSQPGSVLPSSSSLSSSSSTAAAAARPAPPPWQQPRGSAPHRQHEDAEVPPIVMPVSPESAENVLSFWSQRYAPLQASPPLQASRTRLIVETKKSHFGGVFWGGFCTSTAADAARRARLPGGQHHLDDSA